MLIEILPINKYYFYTQWFIANLTTLICIGYCTNSTLYTVLETWGMLHNHQGYSLRWSCNIPTVSMNIIEPGIRAITDLDYGWLVFFSKKLNGSMVYLVLVWRLENTLGQVL